MKKSKKILIISPFFFPEPISTGKFNTDMVLKLKEKGHKISVLCFHPFYPEWKSKFSNESLTDIEIIRGGKRMRYSKKTFLRRIILEIGFTFFVLRKIRRYQKNSDIVIPVFPPSLAFYSIIPFLRKGVQKIGIVHDLQLVYSQQKKGIFHRIISSSISFVEKKCFKSCNKLIFLSEEMKEIASSLYSLDNKKLDVQLPFVTIKDVVETNDLNEIFLEEKQHIVYSGALSKKQYPSKLIEIFDEVTKEIKDTICHVFSQGPIFETLKANNNNNKINFHSLVPKENIEEMYSKSTIQVVPQFPGTSKGSLPSKLPNILASGSKVVVITDKGSEIEKLFLENKLEKVITQWDKKEVVKTIKKLLEKQIDVKNQKEIARKHFSIEGMLTKITS